MDTPTIVAQPPTRATSLVFYLLADDSTGRLVPDHLTEDVRRCLSSLGQTEAERWTREYVRVLLERVFEEMGEEGLQSPGNNVASMMLLAQADWEAIAHIVVWESWLETAQPAEYQTLLQTRLRNLPQQTRV